MPLYDVVEPNRCMRIEKSSLKVTVIKVNKVEVLKDLRILTQRGDRQGWGTVYSTEIINFLNDVSCYSKHVLVLRANQDQLLGDARMHPGILNEKLTFVVSQALIV